MNDKILLPVVVLGVVPVDAVVDVVLGVVCVVSVVTVPDVVVAVVAVVVVGVGVVVVVPIKKSTWFVYLFIYWLINDRPTTG